MFKIFRTHICWIYKMQHLEVSGAVRHTYMSFGSWSTNISLLNLIFVDMQHNLHFSSKKCHAFHNIIFFGVHKIFTFYVKAAGKFKFSALMLRGSKLGGGEIFCTRPDQPWDRPGPLYDGHRVFPGGKTARAWHWPTTLSSAKVKERAIPLLSLWALVACSRLNFTFIFTNSDTKGFIIVW